jgi:hypothetical protein
MNYRQFSEHEASLFSAGNILNRSLDFLLLFKQLTVIHPEDTRETECSIECHAGVVHELSNIILPRLDHAPDVVER